MDEGFIVLVEGANRLACATVGGVLEHVAEAQAALDIVTFDPLVVPGVIAAPKRFILVRDRAGGAMPRALFAGPAKPEHAGVYGFGFRQREIRNG